MAQNVTQDPTDPSPQAPTGPPTPAQTRAADRTALRTAGIIGGLIAALLLGFTLGRTAAVPAAAPASLPDDHPHALGAPSHGHGGTAGVNGEAVVGGVAVGMAATAVGFRMAPASTELPAGRDATFRFQIRGAAGAPVTSFVTVHEKPLHLIVVRRDLTGYQHLHPTMAADGTWSVPLRLPQPGVWHAYADFTATDPAGQQVPLTLGVDITAAGAYRPEPLPAPTNAVAIDGYQVSQEGTPRAGTIQPLRFRVTRAGSPAFLDRYLGAYGHLVVIRENDLGYVHVHADVTMAADSVQFWLSPPSPGRYRMFLDFQTGGKVRTAAFTLVVG
ncbi:hypothetical protein [Pilimelia columellifera]|uniref:Secreted protein n=1 Tax=Pilimelia columellifera subsp. columellifera TaxID=706583 RepID=A0ABP6AP26_9ACTN